jgi:hypothetical protein
MILGLAVMSQGNFYQILGVGSSANAKQIRSAYRDLVKRHHPDLFTTAGEKAAATEKLRLINEAYAVLGNVERRRRYDQEIAPQPKPHRPTPASARRQKGPRPSQHKRRSSLDVIKILKERLGFSKKRAGYLLGGAILVLLLGYAARSQPRWVTAWALLEKLEVSPMETPSSQDWAALAQYASAAECIGTLREKVRKDEQEGSRAVFADQNGAMAITVLVLKTPTIRENFDSPAKPEGSTTDEGSPSQEQRAMTKRVRSLECRPTQRVISESWLRSALRKIGLFA